MTGKILIRKPEWKMTGWYFEEKSMILFFKSRILPVVRMQDYQDNEKEVTSYTSFSFYKVKNLIMIEEIQGFVKCVCALALEL